MTKYLLTITLLLLLSGCASIGKLHTRATEFTRTDAENGLAIAQKANDLPMVRCSVSTLSAVDRLPKPEQITGIVSKIAAQRVIEKLTDEVRRDCAEVKVEARGALVGWFMNLIGAFGR